LEFSRRTIGFGAFEVDLASGELRKHGLRLPLQEQPFLVLAALLERPGEIVSREELVRRLWPDGTFVDFDRGLNAAVTRLRQALSDSADKPRYVETVARRGYRFIAPVGAGVKTGEPPTPLKGNRRVWVALALVFAAIGGVIAWRSMNRPHRTSDISLTRLTADSGLTTDPAISPDGKLVAYASDRAGGQSLDIWVQQIASGGQAIQLTKDEADEHEPSFSPDGTAVVYRSEQRGGGIYVVPALGGQPAFIARNGRNPRFSPVGKWIAYWDGMYIGSPLGGGFGGTIYVVPAGGGQSQQLSGGLVLASHPVWSPDGRQILVFGSKVPAGSLPLGPAKPAADWWIVPLQGGAAKPTGTFEILSRQGLGTTYPAEIPRPSYWTGDWVSFSARFRDMLNLWRIRISAAELRASGPAERITSGTGLEVNASQSADGQQLFASLSLHVNLWRLPVDANQGKVTGELQRLTQGAVIDSNPSMCADGSRVTFGSTRYGSDRKEIWIRDLKSGQETMLVRSEAMPFHPVISPDCSRVAYTQDDGDYAVAATGGPPEKLCADCSMIWDWSADHRRMLLSQRERPDIALFDPATRKLSTFLKSSKSVFQGQFSPDGAWVVFGGERLWIAPVRNGSAAGQTDWIALTEERDDKPRWSPDGNAVYYTSERDGFPCIWARKVHSATKQPLGEPFPIYHFHSARLSMMNVGYGALEIDVSRDSIVLNLGELTGNIWAGRTR
jgi:Tol biopolymer transport system component/DNA-binding winged helix-turn-helix (wHTH) protein